MSKKNRSVSINNKLFDSSNDIKKTINSITGGKKTKTTKLNNDSDQENTEISDNDDDEEEQEEDEEEEQEEEEQENEEENNDVDDDVDDDADDDDDDDDDDGGDDDDSDVEKKNKKDNKKKKYNDSVENLDDKDNKCYAKYALRNEDEINLEEYFMDDIESITKTSKLSKPILTKYEKVRLLSIRARQLAQGAKPLLKNITGLSSKEIARLELKNKIIPLIIERPIPNAGVERWHLSELEIIDFD